MSKILPFMQLLAELCHFYSVSMKEYLFNDDLKQAQLQTNMSNTNSDSDRTLTAQICEIVADTLGIDGGVTPNQTFHSLGADSIDMATLIVTLQDEFPGASELDESALVNIQTAGEVAEFVKAQINS